MPLKRINEKALRTQFDRVRKNGWWDHLAEAASYHFGDDLIDASDLFAIGSRETNWNPRYLKEPGDNGNGFGFLQIDRRSFPAWTASRGWQDARSGIFKGAEVLRQKVDDTRACMGKAFNVKDKRGTIYTCPKGRLLDTALLRRVAIAAYNSGRWAHYHVSKGRDPDHGTTDKDYSADVLARAAVARRWVDREGDV